MSVAFFFASSRFQTLKSALQDNHYSRYKNGQADRCLCIMSFLYSIRVRLQDGIIQRGIRFVVTMTRRLCKFFSNALALQRCVYAERIQNRLAPLNPRVRAPLRLMGHRFARRGSKDD